MSYPSSILAIVCVTFSNLLAAINFCSLMEQKLIKINLKPIKTHCYLCLNDVTNITQYALTIKRKVHILRFSTKMTLFNFLFTFLVLFYTNVLLTYFLCSYYLISSLFSSLCYYLNVLIKIFTLLIFKKTLSTHFVSMLI